MTSFYHFYKVVRLNFIQNNIWKFSVSFFSKSSKSSTQELLLEVFSDFFFLKSLRSLFLGIPQNFFLEILQDIYLGSFKSSSLNRPSAASGKSQFGKSSTKSFCASYWVPSCTLILLSSRTFFSQEFTRISFRKSSKISLLEFNRSSLCESSVDPCRNPPRVPGRISLEESVIAPGICSGPLDENLSKKKIRSPA